MEILGKMHRVLVHILLQLFMQQIDMQLLKLVMKSIIIMVELFWRIDTQQLIWFTKQEK